MEYLTYVTWDFPLLMSQIIGSAASNNSCLCRYLSIYEGVTSKVGYDYS